jgi:hypothetical protein
MSTKETKFVAFRATEELSAAARKRAKEQHRSLSGYLNHLIEQDLGSSILKEEPPAYGSKAKEEIAPTARSSSHITYPKKTRGK